jgi:thiosulfate dehydrogenase [quinone] large subunit
MHTESVSNFVGGPESVTARRLYVPLRNEAVAILLVRLFLAYEWLNAGIAKIQGIQMGGSAYFEGFSTVFASIWAKSNPYPFMTDFLTNTAAPNAPTVVTTIAILEVLVGVSLLLGILVPVSAFGGVVMNAIYYLAAGHTSPSTAGVNLMMIGAQLAVIVAAGGRILGLDAILHKKFPRVPLW